MKKTLLSLSLLLLFLYGVGTAPFFPSWRMVGDTAWDPSLLPVLGRGKVLAFLWLLPVFLGLRGWALAIRRTFFPALGREEGTLLGYSLGLCSFSLYAFALGVNGILDPWLVLLYFLPFLRSGWEGGSAFSGPWERIPFKGPALILFVPLLVLWGAEYLSAPIIWDSVLDHFRFAKEVARQQGIPFHWTNHTGDMPKGAEVLLAGFWALGGEPLARLMSAVPAVLTSWCLLLLARSWGAEGRWVRWIFWTCPLFLALFAWGYVEGFLACFETLALFCLWKASEGSGRGVWTSLCAFFLGAAFSVKYTAAIALFPVLALLLWGRSFREGRRQGLWAACSCFLLPVLPWMVRAALAYGNPFYPLATFWFGSPEGYGPGLEADLWRDTGWVQGRGVGGYLGTFWDVFFTPRNSVGACWTPLVLMSFPWMGRVWREGRARMGWVYALLFLLGWVLCCTSLRHASGSLLILVLLAALAWDKALSGKDRAPKAAFGAGLAVSLWLCFAAQWSTTAPYGSALGLEDPQLRLKRNYSLDLDTYAAYRYIEDHSDPSSKVLAFGVFQTYPLRRTSFVDFFWKRPILLSWASSCRTAEDLARLLRREGVDWFLYQEGEALEAFRREKGFALEGMGEGEYLRFWRTYADPVWSGDNSWVYRLRTEPRTAPGPLPNLPGIQEAFWAGLGRAAKERDLREGSRVCEEMARRFPDLAQAWVCRARWEARRGSFQEAALSAKKARDLGDMGPWLCDTIAEGSKGKGGQYPPAFWTGEAQRARDRIEKEVREALAGYRSGS